MDKWQSTLNCNSVTLEDIPTVAIKEYTTANLWEQAWSKAGQSLFYMEFLHPEIYFETDPRKLSGRKQMIRVKQMCYHLAIEHHNHLDNTSENRKWFRDWIEKFDNEVENQC